MFDHDQSAVFRLVQAVRGRLVAKTLFEVLEVDAQLLHLTGGPVRRAELAQALNMLLFGDLIQRVPEAQAYIREVTGSGGTVCFDHGAMRTVAWPCGGLPPGEAAISRVLRPLGFVHAGTYPLPRLKMTGRAWRHVDFPETVAQFFVSELHPERFSVQFQTAVTRVLADSVDPLGERELFRLDRLARDGALPWRDAVLLLPKMVSCFGRHHGPVRWADYQSLLQESAEMAWISTEGHAFNHATDRVRDLQVLTQAQKSLGRSVKEVIEISQSGRVKQTALRAAPVFRDFLDADNQRISRAVPGSFYEFIERAQLPDGRLDLAFDAGNAAAIFKMTDQTSPA